MKTIRHFVITGRVQGVGFRFYMQRKARELGVTGWVRNRPDGRVEAWFEGDCAAVGALVRWCGDGPRHATVADVQVTEAEPEGHASFAIRG